MKTITLIATTIVTLALIFYTIGIISEQVRKLLTKRVLLFVTIGIIFDVTATTLMIIGSANSPFTLHGLLGYSSLTLMLIDVVLLWRLRKQKGYGSVPHKLHIYSRVAYTWWVLAYITGGLLVML
jgi:uncharacterized repeat protein (TIGR03987 family)